MPNATQIIPGSLYIVAAPSGGGKTSLIKQVLNVTNNIVVSVSHTTRNPRPGERDGVDYFFISEAKYFSMIEEGAFVEHAKVFDYYYGTSAEQINTKLAQGLDLILNIDWQGAAQIRQLYPQATSIFILPPSLEILRQRLQKRAQDADAVILKRMRQAQQDMSHYKEFDYLIINEDFNQACLELQSIIFARRATVNLNSQALSLIERSRCLEVRAQELRNQELLCSLLP